jgi:excisionase family DNA binding protein
MSEPRKLYDHAGAAELLSTSERRIHELRRAGLLHAVRDGRAYRFTDEALQEYIDSLPSFEPKSGQQATEKPARA